MADATCESVLDPDGPVAVVLGTRPEVIKLAPVVRAIQAEPALDIQNISTGQDRELVDQACRALDLELDYDLRLMGERQPLPELLARMMAGLAPVLRDTRPSCVIVQGDTTSTFAGALSAFYQGVPLAHVEAGLRSGDPNDPFPEEANRRMVTPLAAWHFAATDRSHQNLVAEGVDETRILVTGNTGIDSLRWVLDMSRGESAFQRDHRRVLVTLHRRENQKAVIPSAVPQLRSLADQGCEVVIPLHPSPAVRDAILLQLLESGVRVIAPLDYPDFVQTLAEADLVVTDSGGVQEEAPYLGTPVLVARRTTERTESLDAGAARLLGDDMTSLADLALKVLNDGPRLNRVSSPFGDDHAAPRIVDRLRESLNKAAGEGRAA